MARFRASSLVEVGEDKGPAGAGSGAGAGTVFGASAGAVDASIPETEDNIASVDTKEKATGKDCYTSMTKTFIDIVCAPTTDYATIPGVNVDTIEIARKIFNGNRNALRQFLGNYTSAYNKDKKDLDSINKAFEMIELPASGLTFIKDQDVWCFLLSDAKSWKVACSMIKNSADCDFSGLHEFHDSIRTKYIQTADSPTFLDKKRNDFIDYYIKTIEVPGLSALLAEAATKMYDAFPATTPETNETRLKIFIRNFFIETKKQKDHQDWSFLMQPI
jgi:hypothetical protein